MSNVSQVTDLGRVLDRYRVTKVRTVGTALVLLLAGIPAGLFALSINDRMGSLGGSDRVHADQALTFMAVVAGVGLLGGTALLVLAFWGGFGEYFEVRENGLVHGSSWRARGWPWASVRAVERPQAPNTALMRFFGTDRRCVVRFEDGTKVGFDNRVVGRHELEEAVRLHCPQPGQS